MAVSDILDEYFRYLVDKISPAYLLERRVKRNPYAGKFKWIFDMYKDQSSEETRIIILDEMNRIPFSVDSRKAPLDINRLTDAEFLRDRFICEKGYPDTYRSEFFDRYSISVFEVMVALSIRCDKEVMGDPDEPELTTPLWFWTMVKNLKFRPNDCPNEGSLRRSVDYRLDHILTRKYSYYGDGALWVVRDPLKDMRKTDIWMQMQWYMTEKFGENDVI